MIPIINPLAAGCLHDFYVHSGFSRWDHYTTPFFHILLDHGTHSQRDVCAQRTTSRRYLKNLARVPVIWVSGGSVLNWEQPKSGGYDTWVFPVTLMFHLHDLMIIFWTDPLCSSGRSQVAVNSCSCYVAMLQESFTSERCAWNRVSLVPLRPWSRRRTNQGSSSAPRHCELWNSRWMMCVSSLAGWRISRIRRYHDASFSVWDFNISYLMCIYIYQ